MELNRLLFQKSSSSGFPEYIDHNSLLKIHISNISMTNLMAKEWLMSNMQYFVHLKER